MSSTNKKLINYIKNKPDVYEKSTSAFWDDENISKYMLEEHINPESEGATRNHKFIKKSADWISGLLGDTKNKKLLDLGCGPGIYDELFYKNGFNVTGIDFSKRSIEYAKKHAKEKGINIKYHYKNYLDIDYEEKFDIAVLIYCDFGVLPPKDREVILTKARKALKQGGLLILDGFTMKFIDDFEEKEIIEYNKYGFWSEKEHACIQRNHIYQDTLNTLEQYLVITEEDIECYNIWNQVFTKESIVSEIKNAGFENIDLYDDVAGKSYSGKDKTICVVAGK
ncbi:class I SAM-dependent methyltransferase [Anaerofustis stercorihominis]|uniref:class I SAM-dependent methyltransferase n=2 Tax=Anaerofustis stercorihominis TaxID=214853 RepID=UPI002108EFD9|nr:class I SAM-dependent methyltransferase [Anaerofustis stercorihominis]MCQ4794181.1 class I SAM-dependent methyltransferase [Anaerofustis stercorihominis]